LKAEALRLLATPATVIRYGDPARRARERAEFLSSSDEAPRAGSHQWQSAGKFHGVYVCSPLGSRTVNTEPLPGSLATVTSPPIIRASLRERARPSPVPP
jgi:hypothetical protein